VMRNKNFEKFFFNLPREGKKEKRFWKDL
jgi:hypothetical protein